MAAETLRDIIRHGAEAYGEQTAFRYKVKKEIIDKTYNEVNLDSMAVSRAAEALGMKGKHIAWYPCRPGRRWGMCSRCPG